MKRWISILAAVALVVLVVVIFRPKGGEEPGKRPREPRYGDLYREASLPVDPGTLGKAWLENVEMAALRQEWSRLGPADSALVEHLVQDWIYPESQGPYRITSVAQMGDGIDKTIDQRLALAEEFRKHPAWRAGAMRHFPAAAIALNGIEKTLLQYLSLDGSARPHNLAALKTILRLDEAALTKAIEDLASVGWLTQTGEGDSATFAVPDPPIGKSGGLSHLTYDPLEGRTFDVVSFDMALRRNSKVFEEERVKLTGNCAQTGRVVELDIMKGKFIAGRPGQAIAATVNPPGLSNGIFASRRAFTAWKEAHPAAETGPGDPIPVYYRQAVEPAGS